MTIEPATEALFYHLERQPLEAVLPLLLEKTLERGWRAVVQASTADRLDAIDQHLWTYRDDSFLAHGTARDGSPERQPVFLTLADDNPNGAAVRFLIDGAAPGDIAGYVRLVLMFDGRDEVAVAAARGHWKTLKAKGCGVTYWQQGATGKWEKKA